jgi:hypothetical protein
MTSQQQSTRPRGIPEAKQPTAEHMAEAHKFVADQLAKAAPKVPKQPAAA